MILRKGLRRLIRLSGLAVTRVRMHESPRLLPRPPRGGRGRPSIKLTRAAQVLKDERYRI